MKMHRLKSLLLAAAVLAAVPAVVHAQAFRLGIVDLRKVFEGYYKTKEADVRIKEDAAGLEKNVRDMLEDYRKANEDYKQRSEAANDAAISVEERQRRRKAAEDKLIEIKQLEQQVETYRRQSQESLIEKRTRMRDQILKEIRETIVARSKAAGYTLVLDTAAISRNETPIVLYTSGENDMTDEILRQLNANAPAGALR
ncbi:MAG: OmpH family outer membrane protein [Verrucomicrobiae bacterium]|nr:OmpH family outer membrane protein [Verrucomicrobiae bacterium]